MKHHLLRLSAASLTGLVVTLSSGPIQAQTTREEFKQIDDGFRIFTKETFAGNGRTCATCHIPERDYTISPADFATLKPSELELVLASNVPDLENETLVLSLGLFNIGPASANEEFPEGPFRTSMAVEAVDLTTLNAVTTPGSVTEELGWSGDGSPSGFFHHHNNDRNADGTPRAFPNGAIAQHATKSLARVEGVDFRFATDEELDALDAFQRWLGRRIVVHEDAADPRPEYFLEQLTFRDSRAEHGKELFQSPQASCNVCHENGGAHAEPPPGLPPAIGANLNLDTGMDEERTALGPLVGVNIPEDEAVTQAGFNIQSLVQAASKSSFFHNGSVTGSIEDAIEAYFRPPFAREDGIVGTGSPAREILFVFLPPGTDHIDTLEEFEQFGGYNAIGNMGLFIRLLSAYYSLRDCERLIQESIDRIRVRANPGLPAMHCGFNLDRVNRLLRNAHVFPRPHLLVRLLTKSVKHGVLRAAKWRDRRRLRLLLYYVRGMRRSLATTTEVE